eukprot:3582037-Pyramimonas_sp.AAC.1
MRPESPTWHIYPPSTTFRGPLVSSTEAPRGTVRMRPGSPIRHLYQPNTTLRGRIGSSTEAPSGTVRT